MRHASGVRAGGRRISRWFFPQVRPQWGVRLAFFGVGLIALSASFVGTGSAALQWLVLFALIFGVLPLLAHRGGENSGDEESIRRAPGIVTAASLAFLLPWAALTWFVVPRSLGPVAWFWAVIMPWAEVLAYLVKRRLHRVGAEGRTLL